VNHISVVTDHFLRGILYVAPGASIAGCISHQGCLFVPVKAEGTFLLLQCSETFASSAATVAMADDNADLHVFHLFVHDEPLFLYQESLSPYSFRPHLCLFPPKQIIRLAPLPHNIDIIRIDWTA
jgi:hypothetical protein